MGYIKQLGNLNASHTEQKLISFEKSKQEFAVYYWNEKCYKLFEGNILTHGYIFTQYRWFYYVCCCEFLENNKVYFKFCTINYTYKLRDQSIVEKGKEHVCF